MLSIVPTRKQWHKWSLPSKLTCLGTYLGIFSIILTIALYFLTASTTEKRQSNDAQMSAERQFPDSFESEFVSLLTKIPEGSTITIVVKGKDTEDRRIWLEHTAQKKSSLKVIIEEKLILLSKRLSDEFFNDLYSDNGSGLKYNINEFSGLIDYVYLYDIANETVKIIKLNTGEIVAARQFPNSVEE